MTNFYNECLFNYNRIKQNKLENNIANNTTYNNGLINTIDKTIDRKLLKFFISLICLFIPKKKNRQRLREKHLFTKKCNKI
jgi:hypothetical protein